MSRDTFRFLAKLTFPKIFNLLLVRISYLVSILLKRTQVWGFPYFISIEPSSICNLKCPQCPVGEGEIKRENAFLKDEFYRAIIDRMARSAITVNLNFQGEPLMLSNFHDWVQYAEDRGLYTMTSTNGLYLTGEIPMRLVQSGLDRIIVSVDGTDQETYSKYRKGGNLDTVIRGIGALSDAKEKTGSKTPLIIVQFLVLRHNQHQVGQIKELGMAWGADRVHIKSAQIEYPDDKVEWLPDEKKFNRYVRTDDGKLTLKRHLRNRCRRIWETTVITTDGVVVPCCFDKKAQFPMGSLKESGFTLIWKGRAYREFRKQVLRDRQVHSICMNCTEGQGKVIS